jgi:hypothetical protein
MKKFSDPRSGIKHPGSATLGSSIIRNLRIPAFLISRKGKISHHFCGGKAILQCGSGSGPYVQHLVVFESNKISYRLYRWILKFTAKNKIPPQLTSTLGL